MEMVGNGWLMVNEEIAKFEFILIRSFIIKVACPHSMGSLMRSR